MKLICFLSRGKLNLNCLENMKHFITALTILIISFKTSFSQSYYRDIVLKTNVLNPISLGVEFPLSQNTSIEYSARRISWGIVNHHKRRGDRLMLKWHTGLGFLMDEKKTGYFLLGLHSKRESKERYYRRINTRNLAELRQTRAMFGVGVSGKRADFYIAFERILHESKNEFSSIQEDGSRVSSSWKSGPRVSIGFSFSLFRFKGKQ